MFFQKVLKGICGVSRSDVQEIVCEEGIHSNWWRMRRTITNPLIKSVLTEENLFHHLNDYDTPLPAAHSMCAFGARTYGEASPYISTSAGAVERDAFRQRNVLFSPFVTAVQFATDGFRTSGYVFYCYLLTIGKRAVPLEVFSEEVRELHVYTSYLPFHHEGEIVAKVDIPAVQIEKAEPYDGPAVLASLRAGRRPTPSGSVIANPDYEAPENYANIREALS